MGEQVKPQRFLLGYDPDNPANRRLIWQEVARLERRQGPFDGYEAKILAMAGASQGNLGYTNTKEALKWISDWPFKTVSQRREFLDDINIAWNRAYRFCERMRTGAG